MIAAEITISEAITLLGLAERNRDAAKERGSVLQCIDQGDGFRGVVHQVVDKDDPRTWDHGSFAAHGDLIISDGRGGSRISNRYSHWRHIPREQQTYPERFESWMAAPFEDDEDMPGNSYSERLAIQGIMSLFPSDPVDYTYGPIPETTECALGLLAILERDP